MIEDIDSESDVEPERERRDETDINDKKTDHDEEKRVEREREDKSSGDDLITRRSRETSVDTMNRCQTEETQNQAKQRRDRT
jgi:hypothetical protein